jgi:hypothetical protein
MVWEKLNIAPLPKVLPKDEVPTYLKLMWGIIPILTIIIAFVINVQSIFFQALKLKDEIKPDFFKFEVPYTKFPFKIIAVLHLWILLLLGVISYGIYDFYMHNATQVSPKNVVKAYYDAIDFKYYEKAHSLIANYLFRSSCLKPPLLMGF